MSQRRNGRGREMLESKHDKQAWDDLIHSINWDSIEPIIRNECVFIYWTQIDDIMKELLK